MIEFIISKLTIFIVFFINQLGYGGTTLLMALESCNIPIPSEVILSYAGFLVSRNEMNLHLAALMSALGCLLGSMLSYWLGHQLGRPIIWKYGKWLLLSHHEIERADNFIARYGDLTYFFSRLMPVVRTFISFIAGVSHGNFFKFCLYTFLGSWIWSYVLIYIGIILGDHWDNIGPLWDKFQTTIILLILLGIGWHIWRVFRNSRQKQNQQNHPEG
ncbi:alkaline phosphatase [Candidatus Falkowbacteria bacterium CG10_big_fil_rev_8_21_14_0_10_39_9]|uniref:Alkaline phosphatase n=1 Tax=Candidatus Falkowbacteria bacterium CG10_big_fil_rev_8_21_14_0_10_39_9 TaxID=1974566 RepID=A0A2M6WP31_9BACT|nr:MAG: alkaline phosphatase [Candidatus Falkowbacteria bacterium CG10_big_fil_rev_8_21_14_0_10_39_9]